MHETDIYSGFKPDCLVVSSGTTLLYDLDLDSWELSSILQYLNTAGTNWSTKDFTVNGYKNYDEDGNSEEGGVLQIETDGRDHQDFLDLSKIWDEAELVWQKHLNVL